MRFGRPCLIAVFATVAALPAGGCRHQINDSDLRYVSGADVASLLHPAGKRARSLVLADPRDAAQFEAGHLPGAVNLGVMLPERAVDPALSKADVVVVYGRNGGDALARGMAKRLMSLGLANVYLYPGGLEDWTKRGETVETSPRSK